MAKKAIDPNAPVLPPVPGSGAALPPKPKNFEEARDELAALLGCNVAGGHGFDDIIIDPKAKIPREGSWRLFVFSDDPGLKVPATFKELPVSRRRVPKAGL